MSYENGNVDDQTSGSEDSFFFLKVCTQACHYSLMTASVLMGIWFIGRVFEAATHSTIFEPAIICWIGISACILFGVYVLARLVLHMRKLIHAGKFRAILSWIFFAILVASIISVIEGYRIASMGLFATFAGLAEPAQHAIFQLFKFYPVTPALAINLVAAKAMGFNIDVEVLKPLILNTSFIFVFYVWSLVYGVLLIRLRGAKFAKVVHLCFAAAGLFVMMTLKSTSSFTGEQLILLQVGAVVMLFMQVLLSYSSLRSGMIQKYEDAEDMKDLPLPPSAFKVALFLLIILPILTDLQNQFVLASNSRPIVPEMVSEKANGLAQYVPVTHISIHSGPDTGDNIVGVLLKGTVVQALDERNGWVRIGENKWVSLKFLTPNQWDKKSWEG